MCGEEIILQQLLSSLCVKFGKGFGVYSIHFWKEGLRADGLWSVSLLIAWWSWGPCVPWQEGGQRPWS